MNEGARFKAKWSSDKFKAKSGIDYCQDIINHRDGIDAGHLILFDSNGNLKCAASAATASLLHMKYPSLNFLRLLVETNEESSYLIFFNFLAVHFEQLAKLDKIKMDTANGTINYQADLKYATASVIEHAEPLFAAFKRYFGSDEFKLKVASTKISTGYNREKLIVSADALLDKLADLERQLYAGTDALSIATAFRDIDLMLCDSERVLRQDGDFSKLRRLVMPVPDTTAFCDLTIRSELRFSYRHDNCLHEGVRYLDKYVSGFNPKKYQHRSAKLPNSIHHINGDAIEELPFTPRKLSAKLETAFNRYHLIAAQQIYRFLIPYSKEIHQVWWPVYQALEKEIRHNQPVSIFTMRPLADIVDQVGNVDALSAANKFIHNRLIKLVEQEKMLRRFFTSRALLEQRLKLKVTDFEATYQEFFNLIDKLVDKEPEKIGVVTNVLDDLVDLDTNPYDRTIVESLTNNLSAIQSPSPLWITFKAGVFGVVGCVLVASAVVAFPVSVAASSALSLVSVGIIYGMIYISSDMAAKSIRGLWKDERAYESSFQSEAVDISNSLKLFT